MRTIGIWAEHSFQIDSGIPVIRKYLKKSKVLLFTKKGNVKFAREIIKHNNFKIISIDNYTNKYAGYFRYLFELLFIPKNFSFVYETVFFKSRSLKSKLIGSIFFIKIPKKHINYIYCKLNRIFFRKLSIDNYYRIDLLITFTKVYYSYLIPDKTKVPHINIMESWDHPMKFPYYINPNWLLTWNYDLAKETRDVQNFRKVMYIEPLKFKYITNFKKTPDNVLLDKLKNTDYYDELVSIDSKKIILYPTTTHSKGIGHNGELDLIKDLSNIFEDSSYKFFIKPKPLGAKGDYDKFSSLKNTIIGLYSSDPNAYDILDEKYNIYRYLLLKKSTIIINAGTTFAMDAALLDKPVIQLHLKNKNYGDFADFCNVYDVKQYILKHGGIEFDKSLMADFLEKIESFKYIEFSQKLKKWITSKNKY